VGHHEGKAPTARRWQAPSLTLAGGTGNMAGAGAEAALVDDLGQAESRTT